MMLTKTFIIGRRLGRRQLTQGLVAAALMLSGAGFAAAQSFPEREIRLVVPFAPGGTNDSVARIVAESAQKELGVPIVIENKPGGASNTGTAYVAEAEPDGYTLLIQSDTLTTNPIVYPNAGYDARESFAPVAMVARVPVVLAVRKDLEVQTIEEFVELLRQRPGEVTVGTPSVGGGNHLTGLLFRDRMKLDWVDVPYPGAGPAVTDLVGGHVDAMWSMAASLMTHQESGAIRVLAVSTPERSPFLPDAPTVAESTELKDFAVENWQGIFAPAGTPPEVLDKLTKAFIAGASDPAAQERLRGLGMEPAAEEPDVLRNEIETSTPRWESVVKANSISVQ